MNPTNPVTAEDCELTDEAASALLSGGEYSAADIALMPNCEVLAVFTQGEDGFSYTSTKEIFQKGYSAKMAVDAPGLPLELLGELLSVVAQHKERGDGSELEVAIKFQVTCRNKISVSKIFNRMPTAECQDFELTDDALDALRLKLGHIGDDRYIAGLSFEQIEELFRADGDVFRLNGYVHPLAVALTDIDGVDAAQFVETNHAKLMAECAKYEAIDVDGSYAHGYGSFNVTEVKKVKVSKIFKELAVAEADASGNVAT